MESESKSFQCVVVTPERAVLDETVDFVALPMYDGELGVLVNRAPLIGRLGAGDLRLKHGETEKHYFVDGGFAQIRDNVVTVLTSRAVPGEQIDAQALAIQPGADQAGQERVRAQLRVAERSRK